MNPKYKVVEISSQFGRGKVHVIEKRIIVDMR